VSLTQLRRLAKLDRSTVGRNVKALEGFGFVRPGSAEDRRKAAVDLTPAGTDALLRAAPLWREAQGRIETALGASDAARLLTLANSL
jgi:DNA-binding MarR family transcriptional regulator